MAEEDESDKKPNICQLIQKAAAAAVAQEDVWAKHDIPSIPAERVIRHLYDPSTQSFRQEETIVKMQSAAFTHGAMRHCFRMKKLATPPQSAENHRFHSYGWSRASNYVAKAYMKELPEMTIDCSEEAKDAVRNDIVLQHESNHWANAFNDRHPPRRIVFLRAYAIEFPNRPGSPWFAVERFIAGHDSYGASFVKHNTNSGFVDPTIRRTTPQVFSAFSFYKSEGRRLVADIQGVGDLYTDPQVLSSDYRFGEGDLGPRGMALFFHSFRHCSFSDLMGIPIFPLSKNELKHQLKYDEDDATLSDDEQQDDDQKDDGARLQRMDLNRMRRKSVLLLPTDLPIDLAATAKRSNIATTSKDVRASIRANINLQHPATLTRSKSDVDELSHSLISATMDAVFDHRAFHRKASGQVRERVSEQHRKESFRNDVEPAAPMMPTDETRSNLGKVHYQLARLHGMGRFPEMGQEPDVPTMVFHLSHACSLRNVSASVALGRLRAGLDSCVSDNLRGAVPIDFESAKLLFQRAMEVKSAPAKPRAAAGCLLLQILHEEEGTMDVTLMGVVEETLDLLGQAENEEEQAKKSNERSTVKHSSSNGFQVGDLVEANFALEGSFYPGVVTAVEGDDSITVKYDDDGSEETHTADSVRPMIHESTTSSAGGEDPLIDGENEDEQCLVEAYALKAELAVLKEKLGEATEAADLFDQAADGAMNAGKMKSCSEWSTKAAELRATL